MKVTKLHYVDDVDYIQISSVFSAVQFWIDPQNLRCVYHVDCDDTKSCSRIGTKNLSYFPLNEPIFPNKRIKLYTSTATWFRTQLLQYQRRETSHCATAPTGVAEIILGYSRKYPPYPPPPPPAMDDTELGT